MTTNKPSNGSGRIPDMTLSLKSIAIADAIKILQFIGETLGIDYEVDSDEKKGDGTHTVTLGGIYPEGDDSNEENE